MISQGIVETNTDLATLLTQRGSLGSLPISIEDDKTLTNLGETKEDLQKAATQFEAIFIQMLLKNMRKASSEVEGIFPKSTETEIYESMLDESMSQSMAERGDFGFANTLVARYGDHVQNAEPVIQKINQLV